MISSKTKNEPYFEIERLTGNTFVEEVVCLSMNTKETRNCSISIVVSILWLLMRRSLKPSISLRRILIAVVIRKKSITQSNEKNSFSGSEDFALTALVFLLLAVVVKNVF
jgi:hypothetical protein